MGILNIEGEINLRRTFNRALTVGFIGLLLTYPVVASSSQGETPDSSNIIVPPPQIEMNADSGMNADLAITGITDVQCIHTVYVDKADGLRMPFTAIAGNIEVENVGTDKSAGGNLDTEIIIKDYQGYDGSTYDLTVDWDRNQVGRIGAGQSTKVEFQSLTRNHLDGNNIKVTLDAFGDSNTGNNQAETTFSNCIYKEPSEITGTTLFDQAEINRRLAVNHQLIPLAIVNAK